MENRLFGHLLGFLQDDDPGYLNLDRLKPSCPVDPSRPDGKVVMLQPLPQDRTDLRAITPRDLPTATPEVAAEHTLNDFQASLIELVGAMCTARSALASSLRVGAAEDLRIPPFTPDPCCMRWSRPAYADLDFDPEDPTADPLAVEFGNRPR